MSVGTYYAVGSAVDAFLLSLRLQGRSPRTLAYYSHVLGRLSRTFPGRSVKEVVAQTIPYLADLADTGIAPASLNVYLSVLKSFTHWLETEGTIRHDPLDRIKARSVKPVPIRPFTPSEIERLLDAAGQPFEQAILLLLLDTGLRSSELATLRMDDIDLKDSTIHVLGKGGKIRFLALNPMPKVALLSYMGGRAADDGLLWPADWNGKRLAYMLDRIARRAKVSGVHPHRFRHHWAMRCRMQGMDSLTLRVLGGWSSLTMVERYTEAIAAEHALQEHRRYALTAT